MAKKPPTKKAAKKPAAAAAEVQPAWARRLEKKLDTFQNGELLATLRAVRDFLEETVKVSRARTAAPSSPGTFTPAAAETQPAAEAPADGQAADDAAVEAGERTADEG